MKGMNNMKTNLIKTNFVFNSQMFFSFGFFSVFFLEFLNERFSRFSRLINVSLFQRLKIVGLFILNIKGDERNGNILLL